MYVRARARVHVHFSLICNCRLLCGNRVTHFFGLTLEQLSCLSPKDRETPHTFYVHKLCELFVLDINVGVRHRFNPCVLSVCAVFFLHANVLVINGQRL